MANNKDLFQTNIEFGDSWRMDNPILTIGAKGSSYDLVVSSVQLQYGRPVQRFIPLNSAKITLITGRGSGTLNLGVVVGPKDALDNFLNDFSNPCNIENNTIIIAPSGDMICNNKGVSKFVCSYCLLNGVSAQATGGGDIAMLQGGLSLIVGMLNKDKVGGG